MYEQKSVDDLHRFSDRYCKDIPNGWESDTPRLRLSLHGLGSVPDIVERPESQFPLRRQRLTKYYLDAATKSIVPVQPATESSVFHEASGVGASSVNS